MIGSDGALRRDNRMVIDATEVALHRKPSQVLATEHSRAMVIDYSDPLIDHFLPVMNAEYILRRQRVFTRIHGS